MGNSLSIGSGVGSKLWDWSMGSIKLVLYGTALSFYMAVIGHKQPFHRLSAVRLKQH